jgi:alcohol dehydrogenase class IV
MPLVPSFIYDALPGRVLFGAGAVERLGEEVDPLGARRVLAIAGKGVGSATGMAKAMAVEHPAPIVALPTTYAGSEVTPIYGLTGPDGRRTGRDLRAQLGAAWQGRRPPSG